MELELLLLLLILLSSETTIFKFGGAPEIYELEELGILEQDELRDLELLLDELGEFNELDELFGLELDELELDKLDELELDEGLD